MKQNYYLYNLKSLIKNEKFVGWGRKKTGSFAIFLSKIFNRKYVLLEDGFIRSIGLGDDESFSIVKDDIGIYYDATAPSRLERILKEDDLSGDLDTAKKAIELIKAKKISKYNNGSLKLPEYLQKNEKRVLIIAQTKGDMSLKYGYAEIFDDKEIIKRAIEDNPDVKIYLKVHPDVIAGKKESNIDIEYAKKHCEIIDENIHPIVLLEAFDKVYTQTSQMGFEALFLGKEVHIFGAPFYVGWGVENLKWYLPNELKEKILKRRGKKLSIEEIFAGAYIRYSEYYNPFKNEKSDIINTINTIDRYRKIYMQNDGKLYFFGFSFWKRANTKRFFKPLRSNKIFFCKNLSHAKKKGLDKNSKIFIWGKKDFGEIEEYAKEKKLQVFRVEDGFIRSVTLGSDLTKAYSLVVDSRGIYFDPTSESDLEWILNNYEFNEDILKRGEKIKNYLIEKKISKYNIHKDKKLKFNTDKKIVLVVGQVEDDASIIYGGNKMTNLELLRKVYEKRKNEFIIYKPHPDVLAGNRKGNIPKKEALKYADEVIEDVSLPSLLEVCDELHTITSLSGFEALIRDKDVYTYGMPFYAGWGLTIDEKKCERRKRKLSIHELIAGAYILYPRYISPKTGKLCEVEILIKELDELKNRYNNDNIYKLLTDIRNNFFRKIQLIGKAILE
ncbi:capsular polysaccharide biosynthesis protein [Caminibacter pacificus]|jgi:capsular polysaccharide export protein